MQSISGGEQNRNTLDEPVIDTIVRNLKKEWWTYFVEKRSSQMCSKTQSRGAAMSPEKEHWRLIKKWSSRL